MGRETLYKKFNEKGFKTGAEIGVQTGINALDMFKHIPGLKLYLIDPWDVTRAYRRTRRRVASYDAYFIRAKSEDAVREFPDKSFDFVYIDGNHSYDAVMLDIILWSRKVRDGGIISGHDYRRRRGFGVKYAVDDYVKYHKIDLQLSEGRNWHWET